MKKKIFLTLLALLVCMSLLFVSCDKETPPEDTTAPAEEGSNSAEIDIEAGKAAVVKFLKEDSTADKEMMMDAESIIKNLKMTAELDMTVAEETVGLDLAMKDGLLYMSAAGEETYVLMQEDEALSFYKAPNGEWMLDTDSSEEEEDSGDEELMMILSGINFDALTVEDIEYVDGKFVLSNDFIIEMIVDSIIAGVTDGEQVDSATLEEAKAAAKAEIEPVFETMNYEISCKVTDGEVTQYRFIVEMNASAMREMEMLENGVDGHIKFDLSAKLADGGKSFKEITLKMDLYEQNAIDVEMDVKVKMRSQDRISISGEVSMYVPDIFGTISMDLYGTVLMNDDSGFPSTIPSIVQSYMK